MAKRQVFCFDVDGTLESSNGPVSVDALLKLEEKGHLVVIVSESPHYPRGLGDEPLFERIVERGSRAQNLLAVKEKYPGRNYYYISDNQDQAQALEAGVIFMEPATFVKVLDTF